MRRKYIVLLVSVLFILAGCGGAEVVPETGDEPRPPARERFNSTPDDLPNPEVFAGMRIAILVSPARWSQSEFEGLYNNFAQYSHAELIVVTINQEFTLNNSRTGETIQAILIDNIEPCTLDALIINGGGGVDLFYENETVLSFLVEMNAQGKFIGGICGGPNVIAASGIVEGRKVAGHYFYESLLERFGSGYAPDPVLVDGNIVTGQGGRERGLVWAMLTAMADTP